MSLADVVPFITPVATLLLGMVVYVAALMQTLAGFGFALLVMPVAVHVLGVKTAAPLIALVALALYTINLIRYRHALDWSELRRLGLWALFGVPFGFWLLSNVDEGIVRRVLGGVLILYASYALITPELSRPIARYWAYPAGFLAGCLGGAYNIPGPPLIIYGSLRRWPHDRFRAALQAVFFTNAVVVVISHGFSGHITPTVRIHLFILLPLLLLGILTGAVADRLLDVQRLRRPLLILILLLGLSLVR